MSDPRIEHPAGAAARHKNRLSLGLLVASATAIRLVPIVLWPHFPVVRDEVSYIGLAQGLLDGRGLEPTAHGWLWAPLYPFFLAVHEALFGSFTAVRVTQVLLAGVCTVLVYRLGRRLGGERVGLAAGWIYAFEPTLIAFSHYLWTEHLYSLWLLLAVEGALWARDRRPTMSLLPGAALGLAALTRGVGVYTVPFLLPAVLAGRLRDRTAWTRAGWLGLAALVVVLPYSIHASSKHGGLILSDTSVGFNMWLGNNDFEPVSFDYRMGGDTMSEEDYASLPGRKECWSGLPVVEKNACEIKNGLAFIEARPLLFVSRIWTREAQTLNPSSFLVRNLRWGRYEGLPGWLREGLVWAALLAHFLVVMTAALGGVAALGAVAWTGEARASLDSGGGALHATVWGLTLYHLAAAGALIGLSRFRVPLIPLWIPFSALILAHPRVSLARAYGSLGRGALATALALVTVLSLAYVDRAFLP